MRTIKFRAWSKRNGFYINDVQDAYCGTGPEKPFDCFGDALDDDNYDVEQFTGLKDITGLRVYVGDIIKVKGHPFEGSIHIDGNYEVGFDQSSLMYVAGSWQLSELKPYITAVGNVHENPELLGGERCTQSKIKTPASGLVVLTIVKVTGYVPDWEI